MGLTFYLEGVLLTGAFIVVGFFGIGFVILFLFAGLEMALWMGCLWDGCRCRDLMKMLRGLVGSFPR